MLYCGKPPKEKYKKTGENIKKHDLFIYFYLFLSIFLSAPTAQLLIPNSRYLTTDYLTTTESRVTTRKGVLFSAPFFIDSRCVKRYLSPPSMPEGFQYMPSPWAEVTIS